MFYRILSVCSFLVLLAGSTLAGDYDHPSVRAAKPHPLKYEAERKTDFWIKKAQDTLAQKLLETETVTNNKAKNIIMFLGDGMSVHTITATRNLFGDISKEVYFEKFPYFGLSKTYCVDRQVADSACTATAYLGGVKGNYGTIGVNANVRRYNCLDAQNPENWVDSIAKWAQDAGKDAGLVTTARVTHASPAGVYAHTAQRGWENDAEILAANCSPKDNVDIARQLVEWDVGRKLKVILGGGRRNFLDASVRDEEGIPGARVDGRNLINDWLEDKQKQNVNASYVWSRKGLNNVDFDKTEYLLGLFSSSHCPYHGDLKRDHLTQSDPSLSEMTEAALRILKKNDKGFFLFVEGARIDMAHHETRAHKSLEDTEEFAKAVKVAREMFSEDDTLIVVTSDHSHTMTINGYPFRDQDITGLGQSLADDNLPFTILSYANGPGYYSTYGSNGRKRITTKDTLDANFEYMATVPLDSETHGGDDVGVFASGPYAQYFSGNYEQTNIPAMMAKAANIGPFAN
ncbi:alkaline phosphatase 6 isoform 2-T2 [Cochliomyia hominivorax]